MRLVFLLYLAGLLLTLGAISIPPSGFRIVRRRDICAAANCTDQDCPNIICEGLPCSDCLTASGKNLTLHPDTDPLWIPNPDFKLPQPSNRFSPLCRWAIRFYLFAVEPSKSNSTMYSMCTTITELGSTVIGCLAADYPDLAIRAMGQYMRCWYAERALGGEWGTEKGEETVFVEGGTNLSMKAVDFIRDGFDVVRTGRSGENMTLT